MQSALYATPYDCPAYRLPTEAEWEYAARAGDGRATYNGELDNPNTCVASTTMDGIAWHCGNSEVAYEGGVDLSGYEGSGSPNAGTNPVGLLDPNAWNLYDLLGNVWEWCHDWYVEDLGGALAEDPWGSSIGEDRVRRGGSFRYYPRYSRAAGRDALDPTTFGDSLGFRPVRTVP